VFNFFLIVLSKHHNALMHFRPLCTRR